MVSLCRDLVGTWRLVSRLDRAQSGEPVDEPGLGSDPLALLFFDASGNFAAQFMKRDHRVRLLIETALDYADDEPGAARNVWRGIVDSFRTLAELRRFR